jgi:hypothetical protein
MLIISNCFLIVNHFTCKDISNKREYKILIEKINKKNIIENLVIRKKGVFYINMSLR